MSIYGKCMCPRAGRKLDRVSKIGRRRLLAAWRQEHTNNTKLIKKPLDEIRAKERERVAAFRKRCTDDIRKKEHRQQQNTIHVQYLHDNSCISREIHNNLLDQE